MYPSTEGLMLSIRLVGWLFQQALHNRYTRPRTSYLRP